MNVEMLVVGLLKAVSARQRSILDGWIRNKAGTTYRMI